MYMCVYIRMHLPAVVSTFSWAQTVNSPAPIPTYKDAKTSEII